MLSFTINGTLHSIDLAAADCSITPATTLNEYLRQRTPYHATKVGCDEGGCGACSVALTFTDLTTNQTVTRGINSCLAPILSLNGMSVTTNEGIGNLTKPHLIQDTLAKLSGTQCGYCSSGMVMSMYSYLQGNPNATQFEIEQMLDGNLCRCTGYRPILEAFKTFASDGHACDKEKCCKKLGGKPIEIEDAARMLALEPKPHPPAKQLPKPQLHVLRRPHPQEVGAAKAQWIDVTDETKLQYWLNHFSGMKVMLAVGATTQALYRVDYDVYLDVHRIPTFTAITQDSIGVTIGAAVTFTDAIEYLSACTAPSTFGGAHLPQLIAHFHRVASTLIRNRGCVVGNLMLTHQHQTAGNSFPSDAAISLMGVGAKVTIYDTTTSSSSTVSMTTFFATPMSGKYVQSIQVPWAGSANETFKSYKIAIRQTLDHALVNGGMKATVDPTTNKVTGSPIIAIGGVFPVPTRLTTVESAMVGLDVTQAATMTTLCALFSTAVTAGIDPSEGRVAYRLQVAQNYFYKFLLALQPSLPASLASAADVWMTRTVTSSSQTFGSNPVEAPVSLALPKVDGLAQTTGQAVYTADIPSPFGCLHGALVLSDRGNTPIVNVDTTAAAAMPGFVKFFDSTSISPSANVWMMFGAPFGLLFADSHSHFAGQIIGFVVAESESIARDCAELIEAGIEYGTQGGVVVDIETAIAQNTAFPTSSYAPNPQQIACGDVNAAHPDISVSGTLKIHPQFHFHLENHAVLVQSVEGQLIVDIASQAGSNTQASIAFATGLTASEIVVRTRRCGGGYGGKIIYPSAIGCIASIAVQALQRPVRLNLTFKEAMKAFGCRPEYQFQYTVGVKQDGTIVAMQGNVNSTCGQLASGGFGEMTTVLTNIDNCYNTHNFSVNGTVYKSSVPSSAPIRGPGWIQSIAFAEMMMNGVAQKIGMDPSEFRAKNLYVNGDTTPNGTQIRGTEISTLWNKMKPHFEARKTDAAAFNAANSFRKRGVSINLTRFNVAWGGPFNALVSIFSDGSISVVHGGTEIGQGINTKVAQAIAFKFGLSATDVDNLIKIQPTSTTVAASLGNVTGGSITSEMCCMAVMRACDTINERLEGIRTPTMTWSQVIAAAGGANINLVATGFVAVQRAVPASGAARYNSWGCAVTEVEVDALTGQFEIKQSDLLFDCGISMNPAIDIGQVEGGFMFGVGWFTSEIAKWDATTGYSEMAGSWRYKPPGARDLPEVLNVTLLENSNNTMGVLGSKAVGEPPLALAVSVVHALENAVNAVRSQQGQTPFVVTQLPLTVEDIAIACGVTSSSYVLPSQSQ